MLVDTHCHIHEADYPLNTSEVLSNARLAGVSKLICVGTSATSSRRALEFASGEEGVFATIGVHPHHAKEGVGEVLAMFSLQSLPQELVAIGEIGLDYFYTYSPREVQIEAFEAQVDLALRLGLPIAFHVREAFDDFWPILDNFTGVHGVLHSFTDTVVNAEKAMARGFYIGLNGISTFTKDRVEQEMFANLPLGNILLETDAPFLTPVPYRGKVNEPAFVKEVAQYHAKIRNISFDEMVAVTSANADKLFGISTKPLV